MLNENKNEDDNEYDNEDSNNEDDNEDDNDDGDNVNDDWDDDKNDDGFTEMLRRETARTVVRGRPGNIEREKVKNQKTALLSQYL